MRVTKKTTIEEMVKCRSMRPQLRLSHKAPLQTGYEGTISIG